LREEREMKQKSGKELEQEVRKDVNRAMEGFYKRHGLDPADKPPGAPENYVQPNGVQLLKDVTQIQFGLRCMMSMGGYKMKPLTLTDLQIKQRSDVELTRVINTHLMLKAAEMIILRAGLREDYVAQVETLQKQMNEAAKPKPVEGGPALSELAKTLAGEASKEGADHGRGKIIQGPGGASDGAVGEESL
jgi:hypothetical protein